jgi:hypothetical protein
MAPDHDLDELAAELAEFAEPAREVGRSALEERVLAGFEEIQRWVTEHGHPPRHGEGLDIFERLYAVRLGRIREHSELRAMVEEVDHQGLLVGGVDQSGDPAQMSDEELADELAGIGEVETDITALKHVRSRKEIEAAEEIASRKPCADFEEFRPIFERVQSELKNGVRQALPFNKDIGNNIDARVRVGDLYIVGGLLCYVAEMNDFTRTEIGAPQARLRVIYSNGTESNLLMRSLQNALYKDPAGRRVTEPVDGPLFVDQSDADH